MNMFGFISDQYEREARLVPALFITLPLIVFCGLLTPSLQNEYAWIIAVVSSCGGLAIVRAIVRDRGKRIESGLWREWGGMPSMARLRHRDPVFGAEETVSFHKKAVANIDGLIAPTAEEEAPDPDSADSKYEQMSRWILANSRSDKDYALLLKHNIAYGYRRNIYGSKMVALVLNGAVMIAAIFWIGYELKLPTNAPDVSNLNWRHFAALVIPAIHTVIIGAIATKTWVRKAADAYAQQLIGAFHSMK